MNKLFKVIKEDKSQNVYNYTLEFCDESHEIFKAHFPNNPLLPGYLLIDIIAQILNIDIVEILRSKFILPILPNDIIECKITYTEKKYKCVVYKENKKCSEFSFVKK